MMPALANETSEETDLEVAEVEASGTITDSEGHTWAVPDENAEDFDDLSTPHPFGNLHYDPRFHYQLFRDAEVRSATTRGFVVCTEKELGIDKSRMNVTELDKQYGKPESTVFQYEDAVMMKIPKVLAQRVYDRQERERLRTLAEIDPSPEARARAKRSRTGEVKGLSDVINDMKAGGGAVQQSHQSRVSDKLTR